MLFSGSLNLVENIIYFLPSLSSLLFSAIFKVFSNNHFSFLHFFSLGFLVIASYTKLWTSIHSSLGILSTRSNPLNLFITPNCIITGIWFRSYVNGIVVFPIFFNVLKLVFCNEELMIINTVSSRFLSCFADCIYLLQIQLQAT